MCCGMFQNMVLQWVIAYLVGEVKLMNSVEGILKTEYSDDFDEKRKHAMIMSFYKYGKASLNYPQNVDAIASLKKRLELYEQTGNSDYLVDVANFAMLEFMFPRREGAYFKSGTEKESPGVVGMSAGELRDFDAGYKI